MQIRELTPTTDSAANSDISRVLWIMALTAGAGISNVFYVQSMVDLIGGSLGMRPAMLGLVPASTIGGYALGLFFLVPLGDRFDRRQLILLQLGALIVSLLIMASAPNSAILLLGGLAVGICASFTQQIPPFASSLASPATRGRVVGTVVSAIMLGILLARTVSGLVSEFFGWRAVFFAAAVLMAGVGALVYRQLPSSRRTTDLPYWKLIGSMWPLARELAVLREAMLLQALIFGGFNAFWATLPILLQGEPYHSGSGVAGAFGVIGAVGAMAAALAGRLSDRLGPRRVAALSALTVLVSYGVLLLGKWWIGALIIGVATMDAGAQGSLVSNQTRAFALNPLAQNRINTLYTSAMFLGGAAGSAGSALVWVWAGWPGVMGFCAGTSALACVVLMRRRAA
ncbi:MAG TPA: MFS transporter [Steroidobacteraceae bacterium]|jgi:predicted MFS family arabinose efflux permease